MPSVSAFPELVALEREANAAGAALRDPRLAEAVPETISHTARLDVLERETTAPHRARPWPPAMDSPRVLGDLYRLQWVMQNYALQYGDRFAWVTGWSSDFDGRVLIRRRPLEGGRCSTSPRARDRRATLPTTWARPFEVFSRALGMPSRNEADPSVLLAIAVPLMFGYMFGDVGQGLVIAAPVRGRNGPIARCSRRLLRWYSGSVRSVFSLEHVTRSGGILAEPLIPSFDRGRRASRMVRAAGDRIVCWRRRARSAPTLAHRRLRRRTGGILRPRSGGSRSWLWFITGEMRERQLASLATGNSSSGCSNCW
jgi:hypothetical protein